MANKNVPNDASAKSRRPRPEPQSVKQADGNRWKSDSETVERYDETLGQSSADEGGGITNRPIGEEIENQTSLPERGESREGAHAGHGDRKQEER